MNLSRAKRLAPLLMTCTLLAACGWGGARDSDTTGELGTGERASPADVYVAMAAEYYRRGQMDAALQRAKRGIEVDNDNGRAHYMIAFLYQRLGENALAEKHFGEAVRIEPKNPDIRNAWGTYFCSQKRYAEADEQFKAALENPLYATPEVALTNAGMCARQAGKRQEADEYFRRAITANARFGPALYEMADADYQRGNDKSAQSYLDRFFQSTAATPQALLLAIRVERRLRAKKRAATYEQLLRKSFPDSPEVLSINQS